MNITVLVENKPSPHNQALQEEHGLSLLIHSEYKTVLFDTGASEKFATNAKALGEDLREVDALVLSHSHYDHTGGLARFLELNDHAVIYIKKEAFSKKHYSVRGKEQREIGLNKEIVSENKERFRFIETEEEIGKNIWLLSGISGPYPLPKGNNYLYAESMMGKMQKDNFEDELVMVIKKGDNCALISGCSHRGIQNIIQVVTERFQGLTIKAVIGGFHLVDPKYGRTVETEEEINTIANSLNREERIKKYYTGHCTGERAFNQLKKLLNDKLQRINTGSVIEI